MNQKDRSDEELQQLFEHGLALYHDQQYWEAHENWESLWHSYRLDSAARRATKALVQLAAICHKPEQAAAGRAEHDMQRGMERLFKTSRAHLNASFELAPPEPIFDRSQLAELIDELADLHQQWCNGTELKRLRESIGDAARTFSSS